MLLQGYVTHVTVQPVFEQFWMIFEMRQPATGITPNLGNCDRKIDRTMVQFSLVLWIFSVHRTELANTNYFQLCPFILSWQSSIMSTQGHSWWQQLNSAQLDNLHECLFNSIQTIMLSFPMLSWLSAVLVTSSSPPLSWSMITALNMVIVKFWSWKLAR